MKNYQFHIASVTSLLIIESIFLNPQIATLGTLSNHDGNANENVAWKYMLALLVVLRGYSNSFNLYNVAKLSWNRIGRSGVQAETENEKNCRLVLMFSTNLKISYFKLLFCQGRKRNLSKFITHVQGTRLL